MTQKKPSSSRHSCRVDEDLKQTKSDASRTCCEARGWYEVKLDGKKGQSHASLKECFNEIGFDPERPRQEFEDGHSGFSYYERANGKVEIFVDAKEAQKIRKKGFTIKREL